MELRLEGKETSIYIDNQKFRQYPDYKKAVKADNNTIRRGNYNLRKIGKPKDLK